MKLNISKEGYYRLKAVARNLDVDTATHHHHFEVEAGSLQPVSIHYDDWFVEMITKLARHARRQE